MLSRAEIVEGPGRTDCAGRSPFQERSRWGRTKEGLWRPSSWRPEDVLVIDSIGAASAGSITAPVASQILLEAKDPVTLLYQAWVVQDSIESMRAHDDDFPLNGAALDAVARASWA